MTIDKEEFDLEAFVDLFDTAMTSNNPALKKAFKNLLLIAAMIDTSNGLIREAGPLRHLLNRIEDLQNRVSVLETDRFLNRQTTGTAPNVYPSTTTGAVPYPYNTPYYTTSDSTTYGSNTTITYSIDKTWLADIDKTITELENR